MYSTKFFRFLVSVGLILFSYIGYAQPTFVVSNIKGGCTPPAYNDGSFDITVTSAVGNTSVYVFGSGLIQFNKRCRWRSYSRG